MSKAVRHNIVVYYNTFMLYEVNRTPGGSGGVCAWLQFPESSCEQLDILQLHEE